MFETRWPKLLGVLTTLAIPCACQDKSLNAEDHLQGVIEFEERTLAFEVPGRIQSLSVERGSTLKEGQVVATLDDDLEKSVRSARKAELEAAQAQTELLEAGTRPEEIRSLAAQIRAARASEALIEKTLKQERELLKKGVSTQTAVDQLDTRLTASRDRTRSLEHKLSAMKKGARSEEIKSAKARAAVAQSGVHLETKRLERRSLRTPISGTVLDVHAERGEIVAPGTPVITIGDIARPYADVFVPIHKIGGIRVGTKAQVRIDAVAHPFAAHVTWIARKTEFTPRFLFSQRERQNLVLRVRLELDDPQHELLAGLPAFANIEATH